MGSARYVEFGPPSTFFTEMANPLRICLLSEPYSMHVSSVRIWPLFLSISGLKWIAGAMVHGVTMHMSGILEYLYAQHDEKLQNQIIV